MSSIGKADKNLAPGEVHWDGMKIWDVNQPPFRLYGACRREGEQDFKRLPHALPDQIPENPGLKLLYTNTAGLRLRFQTDSRKIILRCGWKAATAFDHMPYSGTSGFDLYTDGVYMGPFLPGVDSEGKWLVPREAGCESSITFPERKMRDMVIHFPLYQDVDSLMIALEEDAQVQPGNSYRQTLPVVYCGSSITQGGCASHAGNAYTAMISRWLNVDHLNLGFSGSFLAEVPMAEYIASIPMAMLVYDYDHNAPDVDHLEKTHERLFQIFRRSQPQTPVLIVSTADRVFGEETEKRRAVIARTCENARAAGDQNVFFLDGQTIYQEMGYGNCTVDRCHPNDLGFWCMAKAIGEEISKILDIPCSSLR